MEVSRPDSCSSGFSVGGLSNLFAASPLPTPPHSPPQSDAGGVESSSNSMHDSQPRDSRGRATHLNLPTGGSGRSSKQAHGGGNPLLGYLLASSKEAFIETSAMVLFLGNEIRGFSRLWSCMHSGCWSQLERRLNPLEQFVPRMCPLVSVFLTSDVFLVRVCWVV